jgi:hypothetical protein
MDRCWTTLEKVSDAAVEQGKSLSRLTSEVQRQNEPWRYGVYQMG